MTTEPTKAMKPSEWDRLDIKVEYEGRVITLPAEPANMPLNKAVEALNRMIKDESQIFNVHEVIDCYPHDGAVAFYKAMKELYGWASPQTVQTFFGPQPPQMVSIKTGIKPTDVVQCPIGQFKLPNVDEPVNAIFHMDDKGRPIFLIHGQVKKRDRHVLLELATVTRRIVREESIYRGKPIRLRVDEDGCLDMSQPPEFMDVTDISATDLLFDNHIQAQIDTSILVPIRETESCRQHNIPLKRSALLEGPYGTGKSLLARLVAHEAENSRFPWTFVLLDRVQGLHTALEFAKRYAPAIVFAEDIDRIADNRSDSTNDLINIIDGVISKGSEIMILLTTNFVEKLDPAILRPGRLDAVVSIRAPGPETVQKLLRHYAGSLIDNDELLEGAGEELKGQIPASIRECVERAKLGMIGRQDKYLTDNDLVVAAQTMKNHLALLNRSTVEESHGDKLAKSLQAIMGSASVNGNGDVDEALENIRVHAVNARDFAKRAAVDTSIIRKKVGA